MDVTLRLGLEDLHLEAAARLDEGALEAWTELFTEHCLYKVMPRENFDRSLPLALLFCESRAGLADRIRAVRETSVFVPRSLRHVGSGFRLRETRQDAWLTSASFAVFETIAGDETRIKAVGRYLDTIVREGEHLRFAERICVLDTNLIPGSLVYPL